MKRKQKLHCSWCGRCVWRGMRRKVITCRQCMLLKARTYGKKRYQERKGEIDSGQYWDSHPQERREYARAWRDKNRERLRKYNANYARKLYRANKKLIADLPCDDCGMRHTEEYRLGKLRRMLPASSEEIHEAHQCIWGPSGYEHRGSAGAQRLRRDLQALGAISIGRGEYMLQGAA